MTSTTDPSKPPGRPRAEIDLNQLAALCQIQCTLEECAGVLGVSEKTIQRRLEELGEEGFDAFYKKHAAGGKTSLRRAQFKAALKGSVPMLIWLGKQHLGQSDKQELTGKNGAALLPPGRVIYDVIDPKRDAD